MQCKSKYTQMFVFYSKQSRAKQMLFLSLVSIHACSCLTFSFLRNREPNNDGWFIVNVLERRSSHVPSTIGHFMTSGWSARVHPSRFVYKHLSGRINLSHSMLIVWCTTVCSSAGHIDFRRGWPVYGDLDSDIPLCRLDGPVRWLVRRYH